MYTLCKLHNICVIACSHMQNIHTIPNILVSFVLLKELKKWIENKWDYFFHRKNLGKQIFKEWTVHKFPRRWTAAALSTSSLTTSSCSTVRRMEHIVLLFAVSLLYMCITQGKNCILLTFTLLTDFSSCCTVALFKPTFWMINILLRNLHSSQRFAHCKLFQ